jgi:hypothetical protein
MDRGAPRLIDIELVESRCRRHNIHDAVKGTHLVEMDLFHCRTVDFRLGHRQQLENGDCIIDHLLGEAALTDYTADLPQPAVMLFGSVNGMPMVMISMPVLVPMLMSVLVPMLMPVLMSVLVLMFMSVFMPMRISMAVTFVCRRIHIPAGVWIENVEFGPHQAVFAYLARPDAKARKP